MSRKIDSIGESLSNFQASLNESGLSFADFLKENYLDRWTGDTAHHVMAVRTTLVTSMQNFLAERGLMNLERVSLSPLTDPLAHDVEHVPTVHYKGHAYHTTHSMIYAKFLACFNRKTKGIFVDSPNIRLEMEDAQGLQRRKYVIDFSQMDVELRRDRGVDLDTYLGHPDKVRSILREDMDKVLGFFEDLIIHAMGAAASRNKADLKALGVEFEEPRKPFPRFPRDRALKQYKATVYEKELGKVTSSQFFWITGLLRENYDLVYPYLLPDGGKKALAGAPSQDIYNYDLCAQAIDGKTGERRDAYEVLSGAIREWLFEPIVERLLDNRVISTAPIFEGGNIVNIEELDGYGPFLMAASRKDEAGRPLFPETMGGGIGIERSLFALLQGGKVKTIDDVMLFAKNPDSHPLYLF